MEKYLGEKIKKLGFGLMRLPMKGKEVDIEHTKKMVDKFIDAGFTYFDTAYVYIDGKSESITKEVLVDRYPRESFQLATKMTIWVTEQKEDVERIFNEQLERTGAGYFDFYLLHALDREKLEKLENFDVWNFVKQKKEEGKIKHYGFSFHDDAETLDKILTDHPDVEFVQLPINYIDWESKDVQSRKCYEVCRKHNKPVIIMEPVKGGSLATLAPEASKVFKEANPDMSVASWAIRFAASLDGVITVLSGMSSEEQANDNISYMKDFKPLSDDERNTIDNVVEIMKSIPTVPCTGCKYCVDGCPMSINIPKIFKVLNHNTVYQNTETCKARYNEIVKDSGKASDCIECRRCETVCPQHIEIPRFLSDAQEIFE